MNLASERSVAGVEAAAVCCDRCPGATTSDTSHFARRRLLKAAVFQPQPVPAVPSVSSVPSVPSVPSVSAIGAAAGPTDNLGASAAMATAHDFNSADHHLYRTVTGTITDISPHFITIGDRDGASQRRLALTADATAWRGEPLEPSALTPGDEAVIRIVPSQSTIADRIWANIGRVCGTILESDSERLLVAESATRPPQVVVISPLAR